MFIQSFEQSNLKWLNRRTNVRLVQLVDANDVNPDGSLDYTAPFDRPYDWTVSGRPGLLARTFGFFATNAGLDEVAAYADGIGPWKPYINSTAAIVVNGDGTVGDANGDGDGQRHRPQAARAHRPGAARARARAAGAPVHVPQRAGQLASDYEGNPINEYLHFYELGRGRVVLGLRGHGLRRAGAVLAPEQRMG